MPVSILEDTSVRYRTFRSYTVTIDNFDIQTIVTSDSTIVKNWIRTTESNHNHNTSNLVVGLDVEWCPTSRTQTYSPVAIIQLCIANRCLIYQILRSNIVSIELPRFLQRYKFVGVGIRDDVNKLIRDYDLEVRKFVDLSDVAADETGNEWMRHRSGLKSLAENVLGMEMEKPREVSTSQWDAVRLNLEQVKYAVADAYVSYKLGTVLKAYKYC